MAENEQLMKNGVWYDDFGDRLNANHWKDESGFQRGRFHMHTTYELHVAVSGHALLECGSKRMELHAPYVAVHRPYIPHRITVYYDEGVYDRFILNLPANDTETLFRWLPQSQPLFDNAFLALSLTHETVSGMLPHLQRAVSLCRSGRNAALRFALSAALEELTVVLPAARVSASEGSGEMDELVRYLLGHLDGKVEIRDVADHFFVSESKLVKDFKSAFGIPFHQYVLQLRIKRAKDMLDAGISGVETARACGFASHSHFITVFRNYIGITPGEYAAERKKYNRE